MDWTICIAQQKKFSIKDSFSKCEQIHKNLWSQSHLLKKSLFSILRASSFLYSDVESFFRSFLLVLKKLSFLEVYWAQGYKSTKFWDFPDIS